MSFEQPVYSFQYNGGEPPTPTRTPTSPSFFLPSFDTPRQDSRHNSQNSPWGSAFANALSPSFRTPNFATFSPLTPNAQGPPGGRDIAAEIATHEQLSQTTIPDSQPDDPNVVQDFGSFDLSSLGHDGGRPQDALKASIDTNVSSAGSMQTPPPTSTSTSRRKGQPEQEMRMIQESPSKANRRMSTPAYASHEPQNTHHSAIEESPVHFPTLEFSPNGFSFPATGPATAPVYPQHKLFWDPEQTSNTVNVDMSMDDTFSAFGITGSRFPDPFNPDASTSFNPFTTSPTTSALQQSAGVSMANHAPSLSQTNLSSSAAVMHSGSTNMRNKGIVNPSLLFSSPSQGPTIHNSMSLSHNVEDEFMQPYAQQVRDAQLEREIKARKQKRKRPPELGDSPAVLAATAALRDDTTSSTRSSPVVADSFFGALPEGPPQLPSRKRMTPDNHYKNSTLSRRRSTKSNHPPPQPAVTLKIDENGRAVTQTSFVKPSSSGPTNYNDMDVDSDSDSSDADSVPSHQSRRRAHFADLPSHSHHNSSSSFRPPSRPVSRLQGSLSTTHDGRASVRFAASDPMSDGNESEVSTVVDSASDNEKGDAGSELRKLVRQRSLSKLKASSKATGGSKGRGRGRGKKDAGRAGGAVAALPYFRTPSRLGQQSKGYPDPSGAGGFAVANSSPTTITDPDLTPSSAISSVAGRGTRCVCGHNAEGAGLMVQCESCHYWLHAACVNLSSNNMPDVYLCTFCTSTPRAARGRGGGPGAAGREPPKTMFPPPIGGRGGAQSPLGYKNR